MSFPGQYEFRYVPVVGDTNISSKIFMSFLTLFGVWGFGTYTPPKFYLWMTGNIPMFSQFMQWLMMVVLCYQGLGSQDLTISIIATTIFFFVFEGVKLLEKKYWKEDVKKTV